MDWRHGYNAETGYTYGYYVETTPLRLAWAALIQGHNSPTRGFRYLDAGCGQGFGLVLAAAAHPDSEFVGIDFLPEHVAHARALAAQCGLTNVQFLEADFLELSQDPTALGEFDYAVCHGITTWIATEVKQALFRMIGRVLRPGGVFYNAYNTLPGWLPTLPFQHLVALEGRGKSGKLALKAARGHMERLEGVSKRLSTSLPGLFERLKTLDQHDQAYLLQEYNHDNWNPVFVSQMIDDLAAVKLSFLGTATLAEIYDVSLHQPLREFLADAADTALREQLRDYATNQSFRRDLYVKGQRRPWRGEQDELIRSWQVIANPFTARPADGQPFVIKAGAVELSGDPAVYGAMLKRLDEAGGVLSVSDLVGTDSRRRNQAISCLTMLMHAGWVLPYQEVDSASAQATNAVIVRAALAGAPYRFASVPAAGGAVPFTDIEWVALNRLLADPTSDSLLDAVHSDLLRMGKRVVREGQALPDGPELRAVLQGIVDEVTRVKLPFIRKAGGI